MNHDDMVIMNQMDQSNILFELIVDRYNLHDYLALLAKEGAIEF